MATRKIAMATQKVAIRLTFCGRDCRTPHILSAFQHQPWGQTETVTANYMTTAGVAELVDAPDSKSGFRKEVRVRLSLPAPIFFSP